MIPSCFLVWAFHWNWIYSSKVVPFLAIVFMLHTIAPCYHQYSSSAWYDCIDVNHRCWWRVIFLLGLVVLRIVICNRSLRLCWLDIGLLRLSMPPLILYRVIHCNWFIIVCGWWPWEHYCLRMSIVNWLVSLMSVLMFLHNMIDKVGLKRCPAFLCFFDAFL